MLKVRQIKEKLLVTEHLDIAEVNYKLAEVYEKQGKYNEAEELHKKNLAVKEEVLGEEHPDTAASYDGLAIVYQKQGKYKKDQVVYICFVIIILQLCLRLFRQTLISSDGVIIGYFLSLEISPFFPSSLIKQFSPCTKISVYPVSKPAIFSTNTFSTS